MPVIRQLGPSASSVILVEGSSNRVLFGNLEAALAEPDTDLRLFGKPEVSGKRRMGVIVARDENLEKALDKAKRAAKTVTVTL